LCVRFDGDDFTCHSFAGDDWRTCRDHVASLLGITRRQTRLPSSTYSSSTRDDSGEDRLRRATNIWRSAVPLPGTTGELYFTKRRELDINKLGDLFQALRWHQDAHAVIAGMSDPTTGIGCGVHRTFLNPDGTKRERKMLGKSGIVRLSRDEDVTQGLGICEGVEDGLRILLSGWAPVWIATSSGGVANFPPLSGVETLTIFQDEDDAGRKATASCASAWSAAGRDVFIVSVKDFSP
jgi:putative DNA primase/helicase